MASITNLRDWQVGGRGISCKYLFLNFAHPRPFLGARRRSSSPFDKNPSLFMTSIFWPLRIHRREWQTESVKELHQVQVSRHLLHLGPIMLTAHVLAWSPYCQTGFRGISAVASVTAHSARRLMRSGAAAARSLRAKLRHFLVYCQLVVQLHRRDRSPSRSQPCYLSNVSGSKSCGVC